MKKKHLGLIVILLIAIVLSFKAYNKNTAPEIDFSALHAKNVDYRVEIQKARDNNQPLFLEFYGEFWQACREMKPLVEAAYKQYGNKVKFVVVDVTTEQGNALANEMQVYGIPAMYFIDTKGNMLDYYSGKLSQEELNAKIESLIP